MPDDHLVDCEQIVANVRELTGIAAGTGPDDDHICAGVKGFVEAFDFRYIQVIRKAVRKYRSVVIGRINPLIRRFQLEELSAAETARRLVEDWAARNFVTAGGFAIEALAVGLSAEAQKSATEGIDLQRYDPETSAYHLYVLKSGLVTRNSDILKALKTNSRKAERILRGDKSVIGVTANYAIAAGRTSPTMFEDGVNRPSTQDLWAELAGLEPAQAVDLVLAMAAEAGRLVRSDAAEPLAALRIMVESYISDVADPTKVDWQWIAQRTMREKSTWRNEDKVRNSSAVEALAADGFGLDGARLEAGEAPPSPIETELAEADETPIEPDDQDEDV